MKRLVRWLSCSALMVMAAGFQAFAQEDPRQAEIVYLDRHERFVVFDRGISQGINVGSEVCINGAQGEQLYCGKLVSSIEQRSGYFVPPQVYAKIKPGQRAIVTVALAEPEQPFLLFFEKQRYVYREEDAAQRAKWEKADSFKPPQGDGKQEEFFSSLSGTGSRMGGQKAAAAQTAVVLKEGLAGGYLYSALSPYSFYQIHYQSPQASSGGQETHLWNRYRKMTGSTTGGMIRYTGPDRGGYNLAYEFYGRLGLWQEDAQNFSPTDKASYVQTDQTAWSAGGALLVRGNLYANGRLRLNPSLGVFVERASLVFLGKAIAGSGASDTFTRLDEQLYTVGMSGSMQATIFFDPIDLFAECNLVLPVVSVKSSTHNAKMPQPEGAAYDPSLTNDIGNSVNLRQAPLGMELLIGLSYDFAGA